MFKTYTAILALLIGLGVSTTIFGENNNFESPCFTISMPSNLKLTLKRIDDHRIYQYVFATDDTDQPELQMRLIVANKKPENNQSTEEFLTNSLGAMLTIYLEGFNLYRYLGDPENKKMLGEKPYHVLFGNTSFSGITLYLGNTDVTFLVARSDDMTYAFTLASQNSDENLRKSNLELLTRILDSIKLKRCAE